MPKITETGADRAARRDAAKAAWVAEAYAGLTYPTGPNRPLPRPKRVGMGGGVPTGRNPDSGGFGRLRSKRLLTPRPDQVHPERHTHPRFKRRARR